MVFMNAAATSWLRSLFGRTKPDYKISKTFNPFQVRPLKQQTNALFVVMQVAALTHQV